MKTFVHPRWMKIGRNHERNQPQSIKYQTLPPSVTNQPCDHLFCLSGIFDGPAVSLAQIKFKATTSNGTGIPLLTFQWSPFVPFASFGGGTQIWAEKTVEKSWRRGGRAFSLPYRPGCPVQPHHRKHTTTPLWGVGFLAKSPVPVERKTSNAQTGSH